MFLFFDIRIIDLQNLAVFCQTLIWISHSYTQVPPSWTSLPSPSMSDPSRLVQSPCLTSLRHKTNPLCLSILWEQFSWVPWPYFFLPGHPFPIKYLALSAHVSCQTIHFRVLDKSPVSGPGRGPPSCNKWWRWQGFFFTVIDILTSWGTEGPPCPPMDQTQWPQLWPFCHWSRSDPRVPWLGKEKETLLTSLPFPLTFLSLTLPILPLVSSPLVLDSGIWSKGLSLGWGLETELLF